MANALKTTFKIDATQSHTFPIISHCEHRLNFFHNADCTDFRNYFEYLKKFPYCPQCGNACSFEITDRIAKRELKQVIIQTPELKEYIVDYIHGVEDEVNYYWLYYDYLNNHNLDHHIILNDEENNIILKNAVADIIKEIKGLKKWTYPPK